MAGKRKGKIHPERLSRYITSKECMNTTDKLVSFFDSLSPVQRVDIKEMFARNKNTTLLINPKYK